MKNKYLQVKIEEEKKKAFKEKCTREGRTMSKVIMRWIDEYLESRKFI